ncbi:MAG: hypothetical protein IJA15_05740 [Clostridia bacterium]|nr:hypothetical protein [Clostridia bacterium]
MKIVKDNLKIVCDINGCNNLAVYKLILDVGGHESIRICDKCLKSFYEEASKKLARKGIKSETVKK